MLSLFDTVVNLDYHDVIFSAFLNACTEQQAFLNKASNAIEHVVANINRKLNEAASRHEGLLLLKTFLPQCSSEILEENVVQWMQHCVKAGNVNHNKDETVDTAYQVLKKLLQMSESMPEMKRPISGLIVPKAIENFQEINPHEVPLAAIECIELLMFMFGSSCQQQKDALETSLIQYLDFNDNAVTKRIAQCMAYLPLLGGGGFAEINHITRWNQGHQKLCATLHGILDELFDGIREVPNSYSCMTNEKLDLPEIEDHTPLSRLHYLSTRFINISKCLQAMLVSEFPVEKTVLPEAVLGIVCRGLAVNSHSLGKKLSADTLMIGALLPQIHITLLNLLDSLVTCCRCHLLPYAPVICRLALQTLKWTSQDQWPYGVEKPFAKLREAACNSLKLWLQVSNTGSCVELIADQLIPLLFQDIWFEKESVTLIAQKSIKGNKKQQRASGTGQCGPGMRASRKHITNKMANSNTCRAALQLLQWILHSATLFLKPSLHRLLQEKTVALLFEIQRSCKPQELPLPFSDSSCRLELYRFLLSLTIEPHSTWPPPTQFTLHILSAGRNDSHLEVSSYCTTALAALEKIIHPPSGTLQFPVSLEDMLQSTKNYKEEFVQPVTMHNENMVVEEEEQEYIGNHKQEFVPPSATQCDKRKLNTQNHPKNKEENLEPSNKDQEQEATKQHSSDEDLEIVYDKVEDGEMEYDESEENMSEGYDEEMGSEEEEDEDEDVDVDERAVISESKFNKKNIALKHSMSKVPNNDDDVEDDIDEEEFEEEEEEDPDIDEEEDEEAQFVDIAESDIDNEELKIGSTCTLQYWDGDNQNENEIADNTNHHMTRVPPSVRMKQGNECEKDDISHVSDTNYSQSRENMIQRTEFKQGPGAQEISVNDHNQVDPLNTDDIDEDGEAENDEPNPKRIRLESSESVVETCESPEKSIKVKENMLEVNEEVEEQPVNGISPASEEITEEEMLQSFVDAVGE